MLNKILNNLKPKNAGSDNNKSDREDQSNDDYSEDDDNNNNAAKKKNNAGENKNPISTLIRVVVIVGLGYLAVDQFILKGDQQPASLPTAQLKPKKNRVKDGTDVKNNKTAETASDQNKVQTKEVIPEITKNDSTPSSTKEETAAKVEPQIKVESPVENISIADKKSEVEEKIIDNKQQSVEEKPESIPAPKTKEAEIDKNIDKMIDTVDKKEKPKTQIEDKDAGKVLLSEDSTPAKESKLEDKIVADDNYTAPPAYDQLGRGLVYNCKDKYWACVEKSSYVVCNKNMKWNTAHNKPSECAVQNVYNSTEDCSVVQKFNVSTNKETTFCK